MDNAKLGGIGASEIGKLFTENGLHAKTAQTLVLEKAEEILNGYKKDITTVAMLHGLFNEEEAFYAVVKPFYPSAKLRSSESIWIKTDLWATPDITDEENSITTDIKCPYTIASYFKNIHRLPSSYIAQNQCQLLATGHKKGMVCLYLTSSRIDDYGNKIEYEIDINERHKFIPIEPQRDYHKEILKRHGKFLKMRDTLYKDLITAPTISDLEFFNLHKRKVVRRLKDKHNVFAWQDKIVRNGLVFYTIQE